MEVSICSNFAPLGFDSAEGDGSHKGCTGSSSISSETQAMRARCGDAVTSRLR